MKVFQFAKVKWDKSNEGYRFVKHIKTMTLKTRRWTSVGEAIAYVEAQYGVEMTSCFCYIDDLASEEVEDEVEVSC